MASHRIKIAARLRPPLPGEITDHDIFVHHSSDESIDSVDGSYISVANPRDTSQIFKFAYVLVPGFEPHDFSRETKNRFSSCYGYDSTQEEIFLNDVEQLLDLVYSGVVSVMISLFENTRLKNLFKTVTIFAYGVTSSGKTHTMQGTKAEPGIIPRTVQVCFVFLWFPLHLTCCRLFSTGRVNTHSISSHSQCPIWNYTRTSRTTSLSFVRMYLLGSFIRASCFILVFCFL